MDQKINKCFNIVHTPHTGRAKKKSAANIRGSSTKPGQLLNTPRTCQNSQTPIDVCIILPADVSVLPWPIEDGDFMPPS